MYILQGDYLYTSKDKKTGLTTDKTKARRYTLKEVEKYLKEGFDYGNFIDEKTNEIIYPREYIVFKINKDFNRIVLLKKDEPGFFRDKNAKTEPCFEYNNGYTRWNKFTAEKMAKEHSAYVILESAYDAIMECK